MQGDAFQFMIVSVFYLTTIIMVIILLWRESTKKNIVFWITLIMFIALVLLSISDCFRGILLGKAVIVSAVGLVTFHMREKELKIKAELAGREQHVFLEWLMHEDRHKNYATLDEAKTAYQQDFDQRQYLDFLHQNNIVSQ
jgi:hypothetical protein